MSRIGDAINRLDTAAFAFVTAFALLVGASISFAVNEIVSAAPVAAPRVQAVADATVHRFNVNGPPILRVHRVVDGDTIEADVLLPFDVALLHQKIRCSDYDAWESSKRRSSVDVTDAEVTKGKAATKDLKELLDSMPIIWLLPADECRDNYGRLLGRLYVADGKRKAFPVSEWMTARGHVRPDSSD